MEGIRTAFLASDFDAFAQKHHLPFHLQTEHGACICQTQDVLREIFGSLSTLFSSQGMTDVVNKRETAAHFSTGDVLVVYPTFVLAKTRIIDNTEAITATLCYQSDRRAASELRFLADSVSLLGKIAGIQVLPVDRA